MESKNALDKETEAIINSLTEEQLEQIDGGTINPYIIDYQPNAIYACKCENCGTINMFDTRAADRPCRKCGTQCPAYEG